MLTPSSPILEKSGSILSPTDPQEQSAWLAFAPIVLTLCYYGLPLRLQQQLWIIFLPQLAGYGALLLWSARNTHLTIHLRCSPTEIRYGLRWGSLIGLLLGMFNLSMITAVLPQLSIDILFLQETPHAQTPAWVMFPFGIVVIGIFVELNFRGFQLGRLLTLFRLLPFGRGLAVLLSALVFSWDPFMVHVFQSLHWIALWDGLIWGILFLRTQNLYATMTAHTIEVWILYSGLKLWFA